MDNNFLIYGGNGWIGKQIIKFLNKNKYNYILGKSRVNEKEIIEKEINQIKPTHILCLVGRTSGIIKNKVFNTIDYLEVKGKIYENIRDNLFSPMILCILCQKYDIHLTYIGTGCIFEYDENHPYEKEINGFNENDKPNFFGSEYSIVKGFTDELVHMYDKYVLNIRLLRYL